MSLESIKEEIQNAVTYEPALPKPDMSILENGRSPPPLPYQLFGAHWGNWIAVMAENTGAPKDYVASALLAGAAAAIGHSRVAKHGQWIVPAILWIASVGMPGSSKSPAADPIREILGVLENDEQPAYQASLKAWESAKIVAQEVKQIWESEAKQAIKMKTPPPDMPDAAMMPVEPCPPRLTVKDITLDRLIELAAGNPRGLTVWTDELAAWFGAFGKYNGGGASEPAAWLEAYEARPYQRDRVKNGGQALKVQRFGLSIFGTIQPDRLNEYLLGSADDGLVPRFLFTWPQRVPPVRVREYNIDTWPLEAFRKLRGLSMSFGTNGTTVSGIKPQELPLTKEGGDLLFEFQNQMWKEVEFTSGHMAGIIAKAPGTLLRLALVLELLWWSAQPTRVEPTVISMNAIQAAKTLLEDYFIPMAKRVMGDAALPDSIRRSITLAKYILEHKPEIINARELNRKSGLPGFRSKAEVAHSAIKELEEAGWLLPAPFRQGDTSGRPRDDWKINPRLWDTLP
jgi:hypothetical protein